MNDFTVEVDPGLFQSMALTEIDNLRRENFNLKLLINQLNKNLKDLETFIIDQSKQSEKLSGTEKS